MGIRSALLRGAASTLEIWPDSGRRYWRILTPERTDAEALASDWYAIGSDLRSAMDRIRREQADRSKSDETS